MLNCKFLTQTLSFNSRDAAEAAKPLLTKQEYGLQYGSQYIRQYFLEEFEKHLQDEFVTVGSSDSFMPKGFKLSAVHNDKGMRYGIWNIASFVSSLDELLHVVKLQTQEYNHYRKQQNQKFEEQKQHPWSSQHLASLLKLETHEQEQLEGFLSAGIYSPKEMVTFDNRTIEQFTKGKDYLD